MKHRRNEGIGGISFGVVRVVWFFPLLHRVELGATSAQRC